MRDLITTLRHSHGLLSHVQFVNKLESGELEVLKLPCDCFALIEWMDTEKGKTLWIHTCVGNYASADYALTTLERYAASNGAVKIAGIARWGWQRLLEQHDFATRGKLTFFEKDM
jgi:hypothetical protein